MLEFIETSTQSSSPTHAVIWLHGLGADGSDFEPVVPILGLAKSVKFVFPHAMVQPVTVNGGMAMRAWYDIYEMQIERKIDRDGLMTSVREVEALIDHQIEQGIPEDRIFVFGFSQGGAVALHLLANTQRKLAGVAALSTYSPDLAEPAATAHHPQTPVAIHHGTQDPVVPLELGQRTFARMKQSGYSPEYKEWPMPHSVLPEQLKELGRWLNKHMD